MPAQSPSVLLRRFAAVSCCNHYPYVNFRRRFARGATTRERDLQRDCPHHS